MSKYKVVVPIHLEFVSEYDFHDMEMNQEVVLNTSFTLKTLRFTVDYSNGTGKITIEDIDSHSELGAFIIAESWLDIIVKLISLYIQTENKNQQYGHMRFTWYKKEMIISPRDGLISDDFSDLLTYNISLDNFSAKLEKLYKSDDLKFISNAYYGALQSSDHKAKYYHAFTIIEYLEQKHSDDGWEGKFDKSDCQETGQVVYNKFIEKNYTKEYAINAKETVINSLSRITVMNRREQLVDVLRNTYKIHKVEYLVDVNVDTDTIKKLIDTRNKLFHGGEITNLKHNMDILILICEKVYWYFLNR